MATREKLYDEVWAEPMTKVGERYKVSSSFLARICKRLNVPCPPRGYWARLKFGQTVRKPSLPKPRPGDELEWVRHGIPRVHIPLAPPNGTSRKPRETAKLPSQHPLLVDVRGHYDAARESHDGYLKPKKRNIVDIYVSKEAVDRALKVANDLFLHLEKQGHSVVFQSLDRNHERPTLNSCDEGKNRTATWGQWGGPARLTVVLVNGVTFALTIFEVWAEFQSRWDQELGKRVRIGPPKPEKIGQSYDWQFHNSWFPSGRLGLRACSPERGIKWEQYWRESRIGEFRTFEDAIRLELEQAVPTIEKLVEQHEREMEEWRQKCDEEHKKWLIQEQERQGVEREKAREKEILESIAAWRKARDIREYIAGIKDLVESAGLDITEGSRRECQKVCVI